MFSDLIRKGNMASVFLLLLCGLIGFTLNSPAQIKLEEIATSNQLWTGVAVSHEGRIFVNYPRWSEATTLSVAEIDNEGNPVPFPSDEWNNWLPEVEAANHFLCVQSVYIDNENYLWILDTGNPFFAGVKDKGAKLIKVNLKNNQIIQTINFDEQATPKNSYLNDVRVDTQLGYAYLTDSNIGAIIVVNLLNGEMFRYLNEHSSTIAEEITITVEGNIFSNKVHSDGIALSPNGRYLYYKALTGKNLYRIKTDLLRSEETPKEIEKGVELVVETYATDAIEFDFQGNLYLSAIEDNAIYKLDEKGILSLVLKDERFKWPDSFSITPNGEIYVTTSQLHLGFNPSQPYKIYKLVREE